MRRIGLGVVAVALTLAACTSGTSDAPERVSIVPGGGGAGCWANEPSGGAPGIAFVDETERLGLVEPLLGMYGHAAAWGDENADGWLDLFVGTFADRPVADYMVRGADGPSTDRLLLGGPDGFTLEGAFPGELARTSGAVFADLDADGDQDLVVSRNQRPGERAELPTEILENRDGSFAVVDDAGLPADLVGRSVGVLDADTDGALDLFIAEDRWSGGSSVLLHNDGGLRFSDVTGDAGLPTDVAGFGVAVSDLDLDGRPDLFVAGSNRLFLATGDGRFEEADAEVFRWTTFGGEDDVTGVAVADVNRDGLPDILLGQHYNSTVDFGQRVPVRLYLHQGVDDRGVPSFRDVTEESGLIGLPTKAPHVEIVDLDNDGWPDIFTTASATDGTRPAVFRNEGLEDGVPRFAAPEGLGSPQYWVTGPTADVDRDGRQDVLLVAWEPGTPSLLLRNDSASGNWLTISAGPELGWGIGARVSVFEAGGLGDPGSLLGSREIVVSQGYSSGQSPEAHFGLGETTTVDVRVERPGGETIDLEGVAANRYVRLPNGC